MSSTIYYTPEPAIGGYKIPSATPTAPARNRAISGSSHLNTTYSKSLPSLPPDVPISTLRRSNLTDPNFTFSAPPRGLLFKRRAWNYETDHGRLCDPDGWQGSSENQQRLDEQRQINEEWLEERGLSPLDASAFKKVEWKKGATLFEVPVSPRTVVIGGAAVGEAPWAQGVEAYGSLNNGRRHQTRVQANREWLQERGESPISIDTFTAMEWYMGSSRQDQGISSSPRCTTLDPTETSSIRYERSTSASSIGRTQHPHPSLSSVTDSLSSFADLINTYNSSHDISGKISTSSIGRTQYPYPSPIPSPSLTNDTYFTSRSDSFTYDSNSDDIEEAQIQTASLALVISPGGSKVLMIGAGHASQTRRSPRSYETPMQEAERLMELHARQAGRSGPLSPEIRLVVVRGRAVRPGGEEESGWSRDSLVRTPTVAEHKRYGIWVKTKGVFGKLDCLGRR